MHCNFQTSVKDIFLEKSAFHLHCNPDKFEGVHDNSTPFETWPVSYLV